MAHGPYGHSKNPNLKKNRLLDHWALSQISTKIKKKIRPVQVTWSQALVLLTRLYGRIIALNFFLITLMISVWDIVKICSNVLGVNFL